MDMVDKILRLAAVKERTGRCAASIYKGIKAGTFPAPIKLGPRASGWLDSEITGWILDRVAASRTAK